MRRAGFVASIIAALYALTKVKPVVAAPPPIVSDFAPIVMDEWTSLLNANGLLPISYLGMKSSHYDNE